MAKKKEDKKQYTDIVSFFEKSRRFLKDERTHFGMGVGLGLFSIFLFISFLSFFFTGYADQSKLENLDASQLVSVNNHIQNWGGSAGARLSDFFINRWLGISSFALCLLFGAIGLKLMRVKQISISKWTGYTFAFMILSSLICGFFFIDSYKDSFIYLGGQHGYHMTLLLEATIGWGGTLLVIIAGVLLFLIAVSSSTIVLIRKAFSYTPKIGKHDKEENDEEPDTAGHTGSESEVMNIFPDTDTDDIPDNSDFTYTPDEDGEVFSNPADMLSTEQDFEVVFEPPRTESIHQEEKQPEGHEFTVEKGVETVEEEEFRGEGPEDYDPTLELSRYRFPTFDLMKTYDDSEHQIDMEEQNANQRRIAETLQNYGIRIQMIKATVGPTITLYEIIPEAGVRIAKIRNLEDDIALSLSALGIRIIAPIPGKGTIGIEVPNREAQIVSMRSVIASRKFQESQYDLPIVLGKTITNDVFTFDLCKMPHVLVAGATGQGKSVGLNAIITSLLYKKHPSQLKLVLVDPKKVEFSIYSNIEKHFLAKLPDSEEAIITDVTKVVQTLNSITKEMDDRYDLLKKAQTRNIKEYNAKFISRRLNPNNGHRYMPYIVVIVDEFADLIMTAGKEVEMPIARIAQLARAVGIHMIIATQRPSTNIITGIIKANFPARVAFRVSSMIDSRTILDCPGANQLIGRGDLLFSQGSSLVRVQCALIDTPEVESICNFIGEQQGYDSAYALPEYVGEGGESSIGEVNLKDRDLKFEEAARLIVLNQQGSTSLIQRKLELGYNRAGRIMDQLEAAGIVGPSEGSKPRQVLVMDEVQLEQILNNLK